MFEQKIFRLSHIVSPRFFSWRNNMHSIKPITALTANIAADILKREKNGYKKHKK